MRTVIPFGEYLPDRPALDNPGLIEASGVLPMVGGYRPAKQFVALTSGALPSRPLGVVSCQDLAGATHIIAGTRTGLYAYRSSGWVLLQGGYNATDDYGWAFAQFGNNLVATNGIDPMQRIELPLVGVSGAVSLLGGGPPRARYLGVVREFVVAGVIDDDVLQFRWCAQNNVESWTAGVGQASFGVLSRGGPLTGIVGGEYGLIFQRRAISLIDYTGGNVIFTRSELFNEIGCVAPRSLVRFADMTFFLSEQGFAMMKGVGEPVLIGDEKVTRTFAAEMQEQHYRRMSAAIDPINRVVIWVAPTADVPSKSYAYHWDLGRWSVLNNGAQFMTTGFTRGLGIDDLGAIYSGIDDVPESLDSTRWQGGAPAVYGFNSTNAAGTFTGANAAAALATGERELMPGRLSRLRHVRPQIDATAVTVTVSGRLRAADAPVATVYTGLRPSGRVPVRENGRYHRFKVATAAGVAWTSAQGIEVEHEAGGGR